MACKKSNPIFLPKSLFDRYIVQTPDGSTKIDRIQTLGGAERKARELAKKLPCVGIEIRSEKHGTLVKAYEPAAGKALKLVTDNSKRFKQQALKEAKEGLKFAVYVGGEHWSTEDTKAEANAVGKAAAKSEGKGYTVKSVTANPSYSPLESTKTPYGKFVIEEGSDGKYYVNGNGGRWPFATLAHARMTVDGYKGTRRSNPDNSADLYESFHGTASTSEMEFVSDEFERTHFAELGILVELKVVTPKGKEATITAPVPNESGHEDDTLVRLASSPDGRSLYFVGGDQCIDMKSLGITAAEVKDMTVLGVLTQVTYRTAKGFHKFKVTDYYHDLGEETGDKPILIYSPHNKALSVAGGAYDVKDVGICN